ncbi:hypothetical protein [Streptomyces sp. NPDC003863]
MQSNRSDHGNMDTTDPLVMGAQVAQLVTQLINPDLSNWMLILLLLGNLLLLAKQKASPPQE